MPSLQAKDADRVVFDLDGVICLGDEAVPGAPAVVDSIRASGRSVAFLTNNSISTREQMRKKLERIGIRAPADEIMTSAYAAARYLARLRPAPRGVFVVGEDGLREEVRQAGLAVLPEIPESGLPASAVRADVLVSGLDRNFTDAKLASALQVLQSGARWVACNTDASYPTDLGPQPGAGAIAAALGRAASVMHSKSGARGPRAASGQAPKPGKIPVIIPARKPDVVIGKPQPFMIELLLEGAGEEARRRTLFVGDCLDTDIAFANKAGLGSVLVLSGICTPSQAARARGLLKPRWCLPSVAELPALLGIR